MIRQFQIYDAIIVEERLLSLLMHCNHPIISKKGMSTKILVCRKLLSCHSVMILFKYSLNKHYKYRLNKYYTLKCIIAIFLGLPSHTTQNELFCAKVHVIISLAYNISLFTKMARPVTEAVLAQYTRYGA
jgi:hypothetical protein